MLNYFTYKYWFKFIVLWFTGLPLKLFVWVCSFMRSIINNLEIGKTNVMNSIRIILINNQDFDVVPLIGDIILTNSSLNTAVLQGQQHLLNSTYCKTYKGSQLNIYLYVTFKALYLCEIRAGGMYFIALTLVWELIALVFFPFWSCISQSAASPLSVSKTRLSTSLSLTRFSSLHSIAHLSAHIKSWGEYMKRSLTF